jgi:hypothetical protein
MKKFRVSEIYSDPRRILMAVETVVVNHGNSGAGCWVHGHIQPIAIIVLDQEVTYAYNTEAKPVSIELLRKDIPELEAMLPELHERIKSRDMFSPQFNCQR